MLRLVWVWGVEDSSHGGLDAGRHIQCRRLAYPGWVTVLVDLARLGLAGARVQVGGCARARVAVEWSRPGREGEAGAVPDRDNVFLPV